MEILLLGYVQRGHAFREDFYMKKRGQLVYKNIISLVVSAIIIVAFISAGRSYGSNEASFKLALAKDIALAIDVIYAYDGDIVFNYPNDISGFEIDIRDGIVKVYSKSQGKNDITAQSYYYSGNTKENLDFSIINSKFIRFEKSNGKLKIYGIQEIETGGNFGGGGASYTGNVIQQKITTTDAVSAAEPLR